MHDSFQLFLHIVQIFHSWRRYKVKVKVTQSCPTLCDPMDYTVDRILQTRILEWVAFPFSRGSSQPRVRTQVFCVAGGFFFQLSHKGSPRILEWVAYPFSSRSSQPRNWTGVSCIAGRFFTNWAVREAQRKWKWSIFSLLEWIILQYVPCCNCILNTKLGNGSMVCYW